MSTQKQPSLVHFFYIGPTQKIESDMHSYPVCSIQDELPTRMIDTESSGK